MAHPLISALELRARLEDLDIVIVDSRWYIDDPGAGRVQYEESHIPGARFVDLDRDLSAAHGPGRHPLPDREAFGALCGSLGIHRSSDVLIYDDRGGGIAARMWWMLTNQGHASVYVLDGGLDAWRAIDGPLTADVPDAEVGDYRTRPWTGTVDRNDVEHRHAETVVIDARAPERYRGEDEPIDPIAGHIPGALSMPSTDNLGYDLRFLPAPVLKERFARLGVTGSQNVVVHCGSGVTACHNLISMTIAGIPMADLYVGSWSDWSTEGMPVATGKNPDG